MESNGLATGITREYVWLPETQIAPVMDARATVPRPIAVVDAVNTASPATWWVSTDHLNRPVRMTDGAKASVWQATWKPFGEPQSITGSATMDARFPGQWFQLESGLHLNWWRHYDPTTGRYTQVDPLGFVDGPSVFEDVGGSVEIGIDLSGLMQLPPDPSGLPPGWHPDPQHQDPNSTKWRGPNGGCLEFAPGEPGETGWAGKPHWHDCTDKTRRKRHWNPGEQCPQPEDNPTPAPANDPVQFAPIPAPPWWLPFVFLPFIFGVPA